MGSIPRESQSIQGMLKDVEKFYIHLARLEKEDLFKNNKISLLPND